ncbi:hypothetical protein [Providencia phage PSTRCR_121]|nr:hypothetical protein [Providencia phage PSTRCR_121]
MKVMSGCKFKKGFMIAIKSWENDADHYKTQIIDGLTQQEVRQMTYVMPFFKSACNDEGLFGNEDFNLLELEEFLMNAVDEGNLTLGFIDKFFFEDGHPDLEKVFDLLGYPVEYDWDFVRVFDNMTIYHLPEDVEIPEFNPEVIVNFK